MKSPPQNSEYFEEIFMAMEKAEPRRERSGIIEGRTIFSKWAEGNGREMA